MELSNTDSIDQILKYSTDEQIYNIVTIEKAKSNQLSKTELLYRLEHTSRVYDEITRLLIVLLESNLHK